MYAVVQTGGKQYRVTPGDYVIVERLPGENGDSIELSEILLIDNDGKVLVGQPFVKDASVHATIVNQNRADKIIVFKKKRRQNYRRKNGHRQLQSVLHIGEIKGDGKSVKAENKPKVSEAAPAAIPSQVAKLAVKQNRKDDAKEAKQARYDEKSSTKKAAAPKAEKAPVKAAAPKAEKVAAPKAEKASAKAAAPKAAAKPAAAKKPAAKKTTDK